MIDNVLPHGIRYNDYMVQVDHGRYRFQLVKYSHKNAYIRVIFNGHCRGWYDTAYDKNITQGDIPDDLYQYIIIYLENALYNSIDLETYITAYELK